MTKSSLLHSSLLVSIAAVVLAACYSGDKGGPAPSSQGGGSTPAGDTDGGTTFEPVSPYVYVQKVKSVLTGLPATDAEVQAVVANPDALAGLVDDWMNGTSNPATKTAYEARLLTFFQFAFEQTQVGKDDLRDLIPDKKTLGGAGQVGSLIQNITESFARTALAFAESRTPFTQTVTTHRFMMTNALMAFYAYMDSEQVHDDESTVDAWAASIPQKKFTLEASAGPIAWADSINPSSPSYLTFYVPDLAGVKKPGCVQDPLTYNVDSTHLYLVMLGVLDDYKVGDTKCGEPLKARDSQLTDDDFDTWRMVTIRTPNVGEKATWFYDLPTIRAANELVLTTPRVGFFTTPAFHMNWPTNVGNMDRAPMNQALIVATGMQVDGTDTTVPPSTPGLDPEHAAPGTACYGCHQLLDPTRSIMQATYSYGYGNQDDANLAAQKGLFAFQGVIQNVSSIDDLATTLAGHPAFAKAWVEKLCYYVSSQKCADDDPELARIVGDFKSGNYDWNALVKELVLSPVTTFASETKTADESTELVALRRRDQLCGALSMRLALPDICGLERLAMQQNPQNAIQAVGQGLPSDGYGRGAPVPILPNVPTLFFRAGTEVICEGIADLVVDVPAGSQIAGSKQYASAQPDAAIDSFVVDVMGSPHSDARYAQAVSILRSHFDGAVAAGATPTDALKSTFVSACLSPSVVGTGL